MIEHSISLSARFDFVITMWYSNETIMPIIESAKKALRQSKKRRALNEGQKKALRAVIKNFKKSLTAEDLSLVYKKLDKASKTNLIKKNKAARLKSRLTHLMVQSSKAVS